MTDTLTLDATRVERDRIADLLAGGGVIDITTTGRRTGRPRRIEITFFDFDGQVYISGLPGPRDWYANMVADPHFTFHLKRGMALDLRASARPITELHERRAIMTRIVRAWRRDAEFERFLSGSPLIAVDFPPEVHG